MTDIDITDEQVRLAGLTAQRAQRELSDALLVMAKWTDAHDGSPVPDDFTETGDLYADLLAKFTVAYKPLIDFRDEHLDIQVYGTEGTDENDPVLRDASERLDAAFDAIDSAVVALENPEDR